MLVVASKSKKPDTATLAILAKPITDSIKEIGDFRDKNRSSVYFNHLSAVSEGIPALNWVFMEPTPAPFVSDMKDAALFYTNRVLKDFKDKDAKHVEWAKSFVQVLTDLQDYVKRQHTTGLSWNASVSYRCFIAEASL